MTPGIAMTADATPAEPIVVPPAPASSSSAREASIGGAVRLAAEAVVRLSSVIATLWLTRSLGVTEFGAFILALSTGLMIAELCDLGLNAIVVPQVVRNAASLRTLISLKGRLTLAVLFSCVLLVPLAARLSGLTQPVIALCSIHFVGSSWIEAAGTSLRSLGRRIDEALLLLVFRASLVLMVLTSPFGLSVPGAALAYAVAVLPALLMGVALLSPYIHALTKDGTNARAILRHAAPMGVNGYLSILSTRIEIFFLQGVFGPHVVGLFGGSIRIVESLLTLPSAIAAGALPAVSRDVLMGSRGAAQRTFGLVVWIAAPCGVGLALRATDVLRVLGPGFVEAAPCLRILSIALFLCFANAALFHILIAASDTVTIPKLTALRVAVAVVAGALLIPFFSAAGASVSFTLSEAVLFGALIQRTRRHASLSPARPIAAAFVACVPMLLALLLIPFSLPSSIAVGAILFCASSAILLSRGTAVCGLA